MIQVADVLSRVGNILNDEQFRRWKKDPELYGWINDAAGEIVITKPAAGAKTVTIETVAGPLQPLPAGSHLLLDIVRNLPSGRRITIADRHRLEEVDPSWYSEIGASSIKHYSYDDRNPLSFYAYPAPAAGVKVEAVVSMVPADIKSDTDKLELGSEYIGPIVSYVIYRSLLKDSEYANGQVAVAHFQAFSEAIGRNTQVSLANSPTGAKP